MLTDGWPKVRIPRQHTSSKQPQLKTQSVSIPDRHSIRTLNHPSSGGKMSSTARLRPKSPSAFGTHQTLLVEDMKFHLSRSLKRLFLRWSPPFPIRLKSTIGRAKLARIFGFSRFCFRILGVARQFCSQSAVRRRPEAARIIVSPTAESDPAPATPRWRMCQNLSDAPRRPLSFPTRDTQLILTSSGD